MFNNFFWGGGNHAVYEMIWKSMVEPDRPQMTVQYDAEKMRFACRITKVRIQTHTQNM